MKQVSLALFLSAVTLQLVSGIQNLENKYPFSTYLDDTFRLHWNYDLEQQKIAFAVNVSTNGWIGLGISPTGKMLESDIVIGWVNKDGSAQFHDRFATIAYILPPIDESQDWTLIGSSQVNEYTILEVVRDLVTCDKKDLPIKAGITHVVYAYHSQRPNKLVTLDSLTPEKLGSATVQLIPGSGDPIKQKLEL